MALLRPLGTAMAEPNQVRCMHVGWDDWIIKTLPMGYEKAPAQAVLRHVAPGRSQSAASPTGRAACSPSQVQCMHVGWDGQKIDIS